MKHASIIPLIGGETLGAEQAFGAKPEYLLSYTPFWSNDKHIVNYYGSSVPYYVIDKGEKPHTYADVISSTCPCAGLSQMSHGYGDDNVNNRWMIESSKYVLGELKPQVLYGENAPGLAGKIGANIRKQLYDIGREHGYSMLVYRTKSLYHGLSQVRERSFYFFFKGDKVPVFNEYRTPYTPIEEVIRSVRSNFQQEVINPKTPSKDPYYRYILEAIHGGRTHREHSALIEPANARGNDTFAYIEKMGHTYKQVGQWMKENGFEKQVEKCERKHAKLEAGGSIMRRGVVVPKDRIGAFVGWYPTSLTHPDEDRFITYREAMTIMGLPSDFELLDPKKSANHICQNVPVQTARDVSHEVIEALNGRREFVNSTYAIQFNTTGEYQMLDRNETSLAAFFN